MAMSALVPRYTAREIRRFADDRLRYEVIRGELFVTPAPGTRHQRAQRDLCHLFHAYLTTHHLGEAIPAPFEVQFDDDTAVQPDVLVLLRDQAPRLSAKRLTGAPALVIEIVSFSSKRTDRLQKRELYQTEGVSEYWIVDVDQRRVERWRRGAASPDICTDRIAWRPTAAVPALDIDLVELFRTAWEGTA